MRTIAAAPVVLSVLAAIAASANAGIDPTSRGTPEPQRRNASERTSLRPITGGMDTAAYQQQVALAAPSAASAGQTMKDASGTKPAAIVIDVIVAFTAK